MAVKHDDQFQDTKPFVAGKPIFFQMVKGGYVKSATFRIHGQVVVTDPGGKAAGVLNAGGIANFLNHLKLTAVTNGKYPGGDLVDLTPLGLLRRQIFDRGYYIDGVCKDAADASAFDGTAGTYNLDLSFPVYFVRRDGKLPIETALKTDEYKMFTWRLDAGTRDSLFTGNTMTFDFSGLSVDMSVDREMTMTGDMHVLFQEDKEINLEGASNAWDVAANLSVGGNYTDLLFTTTSSGALVDTILDQVTLKVGTEQWYDHNDGEIRRENQERVAKGETLTGLYFVEIAKEGGIYGAQGVYGPGDIKCPLKVANPGGANDLLTISSRRVIFKEQIAAAAASAGK